MQRAHGWLKAQSLAVVADFAGGCSHLGNSRNSLQRMTCRYAVELRSTGQPKGLSLRVAFRLST